MTWPWCKKPAREELNLLWGSAILLWLSSEHSPSWWWPCASEFKMFFNIAKEIPPSYFVLNCQQITMSQIVLFSVSESVTLINNHIFHGCSITISMNASIFQRYYPRQCITFHWCPNTLALADILQLWLWQHIRVYPYYTNHQWWGPHLQLAGEYPPPNSPFIVLFLRSLFLRSLHFLRSLLFLRSFLRSLT